MNKVFIAGLMVSSAMCSEYAPHDRYIKIGLGAGLNSKVKIQENSNKFVHDDIDVNRVYLINLVYGMNLKNSQCYNLRGEIEGIYSQSNMSGGKNISNKPVRAGSQQNGDLNAKLLTFGGFGNLYVDSPSLNSLPFFKNLELTKSFVPFAGVGLGLVHTSVKGRFQGSNNKLTSLGSDLGMGYHATVGIAYRANQDYKFDFAYRHINLNHPKIKIEKKSQFNNGSFNHKQNVFYLGVQAKL